MSIRIKKERKSKTNLQPLRQLPRGTRKGIHRLATPKDTRRDKQNIRENEDGKQRHILNRQIHSKLGLRPKSNRLGRSKRRRPGRLLYRVQLHLRHRHRRTRNRMRRPQVTKQARERIQTEKEPGGQQHHRRKNLPGSDIRLRRERDLLHDNRHKRKSRSNSKERD